MSQSFGLNKGKDGAATFPESRKDCGRGWFRTTDQEFNANMDSGAR